MRDAHGMVGRIEMVVGTYTNGGSDTGGDIVTGLSAIYDFSSSCATSQAATVNQAAISGGTVTLTTVADEDGTWKAVGLV